MEQDNFYDENTGDLTEDGFYYLMSGIDYATIERIYLALWEGITTQKVETPSDEIFTLK